MAVCEPETQHRHLMQQNNNIVNGASQGIYLDVESPEIAFTGKKKAAERFNRRLMNHMSHAHLKGKVFSEHVPQLWQTENSEMVALQKTFMENKSKKAKKDRGGEKAKKSDAVSVNNINDENGGQSISCMNQAQAQQQQPPLPPQHQTSQQQQRPPVHQQQQSQDNRCNSTPSSNSQYSARDNLRLFEEFSPASMELVDSNFLESTLGNGNEVDGNFDDINMLLDNICGELIPESPLLRTVDSLDGGHLFRSFLDDDLHMSLLPSEQGRMSVHSGPHLNNACNMSMSHPSPQFSHGNPFSPGYPGNQVSPQSAMYRPKSEAPSEHQNQDSSQSQHHHPQESSIAQQNPHCQMPMGRMEHMHPSNQMNMFPNSEENPPLPPMHRFNSQQDHHSVMSNHPAMGGQMDMHSSRIPMSMQQQPQQRPNGHWMNPQMNLQMNPQMNLNPQMQNGRPPPMNQMDFPQRPQQISRGRQFPPQEIPPSLRVHPGMAMQQQQQGQQRGFQMDPPPMYNPHMQQQVNVNRLNAEVVQNGVPMNHIRGPMYQNGAGMMQNQYMGGPPMQQNARPQMFHNEQHSMFYQQQQQQQQRYQQEPGGVVWNGV